MIIRALLLSVSIAAGLAACKPKPGEVVTETPQAEVPTLDPDAKCNPASGIFDFLVSLGAFDDWTDSPIEPQTIAQFTALDEKPVPTLLIYRFDGQDIRMPVYDDNKILFNASALDPDGGGELCIVDPARKDSPIGGLDFGLDVEFVFKHSSVGYLAADLVKGAETTNAYFYRALGASSAAKTLSSLGPTDWIAVAKPVAFEGDWTPPSVRLMRGDEIMLTPVPDAGEKTIFISLQAVKASNADRLVIDGGAYKLIPSFDPENIRKHNAPDPEQP